MNYFGTTILLVVVGFWNGNPLVSSFVLPSINIEKSLELDIPPNPLTDALGIDIHGGLHIDGLSNPFDQLINSGSKFSSQSQSGQFESSSISAQGQFDSSLNQLIPDRSTSIEEYDLTPNQQSFYPGGGPSGLSIHGQLGFDSRIQNQIPDNFERIDEYNLTPNQQSNYPGSIGGSSSIISQTTRMVQGPNGQFMYPPYQGPSYPPPTYPRSFPNGGGPFRPIYPPNQGGGFPPNGRFMPPYPNGPFPGPGGFYPPPPPPFPPQRGFNNQIPDNFERIDEYNLTPNRLSDGTESSNYSS